MALSGTVPPRVFSCLAVLRLHRSVFLSLHTWTGSVWFICSLMSWMLPRIFFWWPANVTPIRSKSLWSEGRRKRRYKWENLGTFTENFLFFFLNGANKLHMFWRTFSIVPKVNTGGNRGSLAPWQPSIKWLTGEESIKRRHLSSYSESYMLLFPGRWTWEVVSTDHNV